MKQLWIVGVLLSLMFWAMPPSVQANCVVTNDETFAVGTYLPDDKCDTTGAKKTANSIFTDVWDSVNHFLKVSLATLFSGEDQNNNLLMTSGGAVRYFPIMTNVTTNTTSSATIVHGGGKTPMASVTGTGAQTATVTFYGDMEATTANGEWICTLVLNATTKDVRYCNQFTKDYLYYHTVTTLVTGTNATVQAGMAVGAVGNTATTYQTSGVKTADALVVTGPGFLQCIIISEHDAAPTAGTISINDATSAGTGTVIFEWILTTSVFTPLQICPQTTFSTGLYIDFTTTNDVNVSVSYR